MPARFILSLDCEGKWGVADCLGRREHATLTDANLRTAYGDLLRLLDRHAIAATFAFVGLFGESAAGMHRLRPALEPLVAASPDYLGLALADLERGSGEGWHGDWAVAETGAARAGHEIALHGVTHVPWSTVDRAFARAELALLPALASAVRDARTFIYPRNDVAHAELLPTAGIEAYRLAPRARSRARALLSEFNPLSPPEADPSQNGVPTRIPGGYFVNWRHGPRKLVPPSLTVARAARMLARAGREDKVVHLWLHPENVASAPATLDVLDAILRAVVRMREAGQCEVLTQIDYCRRVIAS